MKKRKTHFQSVRVDRKLYLELKKAKGNKSFSDFISELLSNFFDWDVTIVNPLLIGGHIKAEVASGGS